MPSVTRMPAILGAHLHSTLGWVAYRLGWATTARRHYERVILLRGVDFRAYVQLGRIAFDQGDYAGWRREFEHARRADPIRFARLRHPLELFEPRLAGTQRNDHAQQGPRDGYLATDARATWRQPQTFDGRAHDPSAQESPGRSAEMPLAPGFDPVAPSEHLDDGDVVDLHGSADPFSAAARDATPADTERPRPIPRPTPPDASLTRDDFSSPAERRRFQLRRPIDRREIARCDITDLVRRLSG